jgi:hypothetical protein
VQSVPHIDLLPERRPVSYSSTTLRLIDAVARQARPTRITRTLRTTRQTRLTSHTSQIAQQKAARDWMANAGQQTVKTVRRWAVQAWLLAQTPQQFASEWASGKRQALNPLRFLAVGGAVAILGEQAARLASGLPTERGWQGWLNGSLGQILHVAVLGALMHLVLRRVSKTPAPFATSFGAVLFAVGGPGVLCSFPGWAATILLHLRGAAVPQISTHTGLTLPVPVLAASVFGLAWMLATTAAVHGVRWWRSLVAFTASIAAMAFVGGTFEFAARLLAR